MKIETERLILREHKDEDVNCLVEGLNNLRVSKWMSSVPYPYTKKEAKKWIDRCKESSKKRKKRDRYDFAIVLKSENKLIGGLNISGIDQFNGLASGGIWINEKYHGKGYGTEAFNARLWFAFEKLKLRRLESGFLKGNKASRNMQLKLGYKLEGMRRKGFICKADGKVKDEYTLGLLKKEWKRLKFKVKQKR